jgi:phosphoesterase RecJ-like protein
VIGAVKDLIEQHERVTILTHLNPDADTIGTALGIYTLLKKQGKQVEVANYGEKIPNYLDFLPHFAKIKNRIDFKNSLIIACDTGSIDRLGFELVNREIINIDHHKSNMNYGLVNVVDVKAVSASQVAFELFKSEFQLTSEVATCFYTALLSDTQFFSTNNLSKKVFDVASEMIGYGVDVSKVVMNLKSRNSLASIRILSSAIDTLELLEAGQLVTMFASRQKMLETGAEMSDIDGIVNYGISLVTAEISLFLVECEEHIRVSIRSKRVDISTLALSFGGGGHRYAAGFEIENIGLEELLEAIKEKIKKERLLDET